MRVKSFDIEFMHGRRKRSAQVNVYPRAVSPLKCPMYRVFVPEKDGSGTVFILYDVKGEKERFFWYANQDAVMSNGIAKALNKASG
ncbi:MAG: hypothetical protein ABW007_00700 [Chitinophagaceae bacterium]